jgi:hypothetical protein
MLFGVEARNEVFQIQINFDLTEHGVPSAIFLCLDKPEFAPQMISGFPRSLLSHDPSSRRCSSLRYRVLQVPSPIADTSPADSDALRDSPGPL